VAIFTKPQIFFYLERIARSCVDEPKCPISHFVDTNEIPFLLLPNHAERIPYKACTLHHARALTMNVNHLIPDD